MPHIYTHYDNLKVARNAPPEVIRAAYKTLSQKFHPDRNPGNPNATRTFQLIKTAYEVLSDPVKRKAHDEWIAAEEAKVQASERAIETPQDLERVTKTLPKAPTDSVRQSPRIYTWNTRSRKWRTHHFASTRREWMGINRLFKYFFWLLLPTLILLIAVTI